MATSGGQESARLQYTTVAASLGLSPRHEAVRDEQLLSQRAVSIAFRRSVPPSRGVERTLPRPDAPVSIAFRRSVPPSPDYRRLLPHYRADWSPLPFGVLSPRHMVERQFYSEPTAWVSIAFRRSVPPSRRHWHRNPHADVQSPLPFGVLSPRHKIGVQGGADPLPVSPLPFGVLSPRHEGDFAQALKQLRKSPLPFGVLSPRHKRFSLPTIIPCLRSPLPFGVLSPRHPNYTVPHHRRQTCLHCLSAFCPPVTGRFK